jgi:hypothetical protein
MLQFNIAYLQEVCLLDEKQRKNLMTYYGKLSEVEKMEVERVRTEIWLKNKHLLKTEVKTEYNFAMQLLAIAKLQADEKAVNKLHRTTPEQRKSVALREVARLKELKLKQTAPIRAAIEERYFDIKQFRELELSWRDVAVALKKHYPKQFRTVNVSYLRKTWIEINQQHQQRHERIQK